MLGSGEYSPVAEASIALVIQAENHLDDMTSMADVPLPEVGQVRFTILTYSGTLSTEASEKAITAGKHHLSPLYKRAQDTLAQIRMLAKRKSQ